MYINKSLFYEKCYSLVKSLINSLRNQILYFGVGKLFFIINIGMQILVFEIFFFDLFLFLIIDYFYVMLFIDFLIRSVLYLFNLGFFYCKLKVRSFLLVVIL